MVDNQQMRAVAVGQGSLMGNPFTPLFRLSLLLSVQHGSPLTNGPSQGGQMTLRPFNDDRMQDHKQTLKSVQTYLHLSTEVALLCQGRHVTTSALCSDSSSDVLISTASWILFIERFTTSLARSPGG